MDGSTQRAEGIQTFKIHFATVSLARYSVALFESCHMRDQFV